MRTLIVTSCPEPWGGSEELWWEAAQRLLDDPRHRVCVAKVPLDADHPRIRALIERGCRTRDIGARCGRIATLVSLLLPGRFRIDARRLTSLYFASELMRWRPSLVVVSQGQNYDGLLFARICRLMRMPYMVIAQKASETYWPLDHFRPIYRAAYADARRSVFVSRHNLRVTEDQLAMHLANAVVLSNPVAVGRDQGPLPWPELSGETIRLACVGRLYPSEKGQDVLLRVLARARWRSRPVTVTLFGAGVAREGLEELAAHLALNNVTFAGHVGDMLEVWRTHHALVLPSRAEGLPLALVEALMCGRPAIVSDVGGNSEVIDDGRTGFLASGPEVDAFDAALERAWQNRADWPAMGARAAADVRERVSADPAGDLVRVIEAAAASSASRG
jgi:glycosyltransferase involved in cell wall biosynthesis